MAYIAHVKKEDDSDHWAAPHELSEHLLATAQLAETFAQYVGSDWAELAGRWHDMGKYRKRFQGYIRIQSGYEKENVHIENGKRAPHSTAGAIHAVKHLPAGEGHIIAYLIAGHHAGLPDWFGGKGSLNHRLHVGLAEYQEALVENIPDNILTGDNPAILKHIKTPEAFALWMRILFSCLVDADFLDTERYMQPKRFSDRETPASLDKLQRQFFESIEKLQNNSTQSPLNTIRNSILKQCTNAAELKPGLFSLTVPTGGGKTLSSLAFALKHAQIHNKKRIIYAIPFTSIIEQNADVFRKFLEDDNAVLEHHSNFDVAPTKENSKARLAAENWDTPLIVTTNVQLFESLHASRTSRCRKLHNIVNSIIILDEAQQIPRDFHAPITRVMQQLSDYYGVTWVLCTATQPVLTKSSNAFGKIILEGLNDVREIINNPVELAETLNRVKVHLPFDKQETNWTALAKKIEQEDCALVIVNTRKQARVLCELLPDDNSTLHLSANMCAQHRTRLIRDIKDRLQQKKQGKDSRPLRVVSTQLIEAGVDIDFPVVYRAMSGLDSIAQAAGRCNREGKLKDNNGKLSKGNVYVFIPEQASMPGYLRQGEDTTVNMMATGEFNNGKILSPENFEKYFSLMNAKGNRDKHDIIPLLTAQSSPDAPLTIQFREAAKKFRLIDNNGTAIIVPFKPDSENEGEDEKISPIENWLAQLEADPSQKWVYKKLQRYTVTVTESVVKELYANKCIDERAGLFVLLETYYHKRWGVDSADTLITPEKTIF